MTQRRYHVTYYYLATGMEGRADIEDYGEVYAADTENAKYAAARMRHPTMSPQDLNWVMGCLIAKEIR